MTEAQEDQINDKVIKMYDHLEWQLKAGNISLQQYNDAMLDLGKWAVMARQRQSTRRNSRVGNPRARGSKPRR